MRKHNRIRDWLAKLIAEWTNRPTKTQQVVPKWTREVRDATAPGGKMVAETRLDVAYLDKNRRRAYVDVSVTDAATVDLERLTRRARTDGAAAAAQEDVKRLRYPGAELIPFVLESLERPGSPLWG